MAEEKTPLKWKFETGGHVSSPILSEGILYFGSDDSHLYALDSKTGKEKWKFEVGSYTSVKSPISSEGTVYFGASDYFLYALDSQTGKEKWKFEAGRTINSSPILSNGVLYFGSDDCHVYALDSQTGKEKWKFKTGDYVVCSPVVSDGIVYFGSQDCYLYAIDSQTGKEKWKFKTGDYVNSSPILSNGVLYFGSDDYHLYALDSQTGKEKWKCETGGYIFGSSPAISEGIVYFGASDNYLYALDSQTGKEKWKFETGDCISGSSPIVIEETIYFGSNDSHLYALDSQTGKEKWKFKTGDYVECSPVMSDGIVYFGSQDNHYYAVNINVGNALAPVKKAEELQQKQLEIKMLEEADKNGITEEDIKTKYISGEITLEEAIELQSQHDKEEKLKLKWKEEATNNIIRVNCEPTADLDTMLLLKGCLVLVLDPDKGWAYGNHIKHQGGGTFGEYHVIMKHTLDDDESPNWEIAVGLWFGHNCSEDELIETASGLDGFDIIKAKVIFEVVQETWSRFVQYGSDENPDYETTYLCQKNVIPNANDDGALWYAEDNFDQDDKMSTIDIELVSESVPGNMVFIS